MDALVECGVFTQKNLELIVRVQNTRKKNLLFKEHVYLHLLPLCVLFVLLYLCMIHYNLRLLPLGCICFTGAIWSVAVLSFPIVMTLKVYRVFVQQQIINRTNSSYQAVHGEPLSY